MPEENAGNRVERLEQLLDVSRHQRPNLDLESSLQVVVDAACKLTGSEHSSTLLFEEETGLLRYIASTNADKVVLKCSRVPLQHIISCKVYTD